MDSNNNIETSEHDRLVARAAFLAVAPMMDEVPYRLAAAVSIVRDYLQGKPLRHGDVACAADLMLGAIEPKGGARFFDEAEMRAAIEAAIR